MMTIKIDKRGVSILHLSGTFEGWITVTNSLGKLTYHPLPSTFDGRSPIDMIQKQLPEKCESLPYIVETGPEKIM